MSQQEKSRLYQALKAAGVTFSKPYKNYTVAELQAGYDRYLEEIAKLDQPAKAPEPQEQPVEEQPSLSEQDMGKLAAAALAEAMSGGELPPPPAPPQAVAPSAPPVRVGPADPNEMAGQRLNTSTGEPIRQDEFGRVWYQEEVLKPAYPKSRGRRILRTQDAPTVQKTVHEGQFSETFEIAGEGPKQATEIKVTLPSFQVGVYRRKGLPFAVITYNGNEGFDRDEIDKYYGGRELVPATIKRKYVENVLCYDIPSVVRTINEAYRHLQLTGRV